MAAAGKKWADLRPRILTALVLVAVGGMGVWLGGGWYAALLGLVLIGVLWELSSIVFGAEFAPSFLNTAFGACLFLLFCLSVAGLEIPIIDPVFAGFAGLICLGALMALRLRMATLYVLLGTILIVLAVFCLESLRQEASGLALTLWLIGVVAGSDIGAYFAGRSIGGPKLWPAVSPGKTISGAVGGLLTAIIIGLAVMAWAGWPIAATSTIIYSALVSAGSMAGDLAQSAVKRAFGVKDSGTILPGHGGLWDRFDGFIGAGVTLAAIQLIASPL